MSYENFLIRDSIPQVPEGAWCSQCERHVEDCVCEEICDHFRETVGSAGDGDSVCFPAPSPVPLQLDYPVWRMSFSAYGEHMGWEVPQ
jgi:hypothetical protein